MNFIIGPSLNFGRRAHAAKTIIDPLSKDQFILVTGGVDESNEPLDSVEILKLGSSTWQLGMCWLHTNFHGICLHMLRANLFKSML